MVVQAVQAVLQESRTMQSVANQAQHHNIPVAVAVAVAVVVAEEEVAEEGEVTVDDLEVRQELQKLCSSTAITERTCTQPSPLSSFIVMPLAMADYV